MTSKKYEKDCARLVQEGAEVSYSTALRWVRENEAAHPETLSPETRALRIIEAAKFDRP